MHNRVQLQHSNNASKTIYAKWAYFAEFDNQNHGNQVEKKAAGNDGKLVASSASEVGTQSGLELEGWYKDAKCSEAFDFDQVLTESVKLYANWVADDDEVNNFWLAPSSKITNTSAAPADNANYVKENWNVKKSSKEILADVEKIKEGDTTVIEEYETLMKDDAYHLYTAWKGDTTDSSGEAQTANAFVEFRIIHVGDHDGDQSSLTFQATHMLPTALSMMNNSSSTWSWGGSVLKGLMVPGGSIYKSFNKGLTDNVKSQVQKMSLDGDGKTTASSSPSDFWVTSRSEISRTTETGYKEEGTQYAYYKNLSINDSASGTNACLAKTTRAGNQAKGADNEGKWLMRTPDISTAINCFSVDENGCVAKSFKAIYAYGVVPAFCMG